MFCRNCGNKIPDGAKFCAICGTKINSGQFPKEKKSWLALMCIPIIFLILFSVGAAVCMTMDLEHKKENLISAIETSGIPEYIDREEVLNRAWNTLGAGDVSAKKDLLVKLESLVQGAEDFMACVQEVEQLQSEKEKYCLNENEYEIYEEALNKCVQAVEQKEAENIDSLLADAKKSLEALVKANDVQISDVMQVYEGLDLSGAKKGELAAYKKYIEQLNELTEAGNKDYQAISQIFSEMNETISMYMEPENLLNISVQQVDVFDFPKVKLYLSVRNAVSGKVPDNLDNGMFYVRKEDANAQYVKQVVTAVNQLNEKEVLKVDMVADVSGSMDGTLLDEAKNSMRSFISSVQFSAGDMVELTSFSTGVRLEQEFCSDANLLIQKINNLYTEDMTSLYDALYTAVERVAAQSGARCVVAFTDGNDNYSNCTREDVVIAAQRYHVPIFIIGIGDADYSDASYIARQTGGTYYNVDDVYSMGSIYDEIYRTEKEMFLVEFEDNTGSKVSDVSNIETGYRDMNYGGECSYSYTPNVLLDADGDVFYKDGPEAVVEKYMRGFAEAVTESDFSYISDYLKPGSAIYNEQQKYVQRDIKEQVDSFEIVSVDYKDENNCVVQTRETYFVQVENQPLQLMTQECQYAVEQDGSGWKITAFVGSVNVLSRIRQ